MWNECHKSHSTWGHVTAYLPQCRQWKAKVGQGATQILLLEVPVASSINGTLPVRVLNDYNLMSP
jgi:hypothetical protein